MSYFIHLIYFTIAIIATTVGSMTGLGGGVIIKPILDIWGIDSLQTINILSSATIFTMTCVSITKHLRAKTPLHYPSALTISMGAVIGGFLGQTMFQGLQDYLPSPSYTTLIQNLVLATLILISFIYILLSDRLPHCLLHNLPLKMVLGLCLGFISSLLGVGGGPINVAAFVLFLGVDSKKAAVYSIVVIFFAQLSKISTVALTVATTELNLVQLPFMMLGGVLGGFCGTKLNHRLPSQTIKKAFAALLIAVIGVCLFNATRAMLG